MSDVKVERRDREAAARTLRGSWHEESMTAQWVATGEYSVPDEDASPFWRDSLVAQAIAQAREEGRREGAEQERDSICGFAECANPNSRTVRALVADIRRGEHSKGMGDLLASDSRLETAREEGRREVAEKVEAFAAWYTDPALDDLVRELGAQPLKNKR